MKIKVISDTHNDHHHLTDLECDVLIHCGDYGTRGNYTECENFLWWFVKQPAKYKLVVPGNHDGKIKKHGDLQLLAKHLGIHVLRNEGITINNYKFWGGDFVPKFKKKTNAFWTTLEERVEKWKDMDKDTAVLITHVPPRLILDTNIDKVHLGCDALRKKVEEIEPLYHVFGHIHEWGNRIATIPNIDTIFMNCAVKNRDYLTVYGAQTFYLPDIE